MTPLLLYNGYANANIEHRGAEKPQQTHSNIFTGYGQ